MRRTGFWVAVGSLGLLAGTVVVAQPAVADTTTTGTGLAPVSASALQALSTNVSKKVIVVLKDQVPQAPAGSGSVQARQKVEAPEQSPIVNDLHMTKAVNVHSYTLLNAVSATVSPDEESRLASDPSVAEVVPDQIIHLQNTLGTPSASAASSVGPSRAPVPGTCSNNPQAPELEPQALSDIGAASADPTAQTASSLGITGAGEKVAFIADGLDTNNADFVRPNGQKVFVDYKDFSGEGTGVATGGGEAFLDASSIAAQGQQTYDISQYSALPLNQHCYIRIQGVAPGASLVGLDIFGAENAGYNSSFLQAIDYSVSTDHVSVLNESLGVNNYPDDQASLDLIKSANDAATAAGTTVTVSSGDAGVTGTVGSPASDPNVISAGASTTYETPSQLGYGGFQFPGVTGFLNDNISSLSSSGFEQDGSTISVVAPGELNWALCSTNVAMYSECSNYQGKPSPIQESGGTSEAAPLTAGTAALVIQAYAKTHGGANPSPALVKQFITSTAKDIDAPGDLQGSGLIDAYRAVLAAESYKAPAPANTPSTLLEGTSQFNAVAAGGTAEKFTEQLTNTGSGPVVVAPSSRTLGAYQSIASTTVNLSDTASPHDTDYQGVANNYEAVHFTVPAGVDRLNGSIAYKGASTTDLNARVRMTLIDPEGELADYSLPQGVGNFGNAQVASPRPGVWTAYIWSRSSANGGTTGPVLFGASTANYQSFGTVSPASLTLAPGATKSVTLSVKTPSSPGDVAGSLDLGLGGQPNLSVPVTLRTLAPSGTTSFNGVLTGGNGREPNTGVTDYYQFDVAAGKPELNASIALANNPDNQTYAWLVDPSGQAQAYQSNDLLTADDRGNVSATNTLGTDLHVLNPAAGRWTLIVGFIPTVSGTALSEPFTVSLDQKAASVTAKGVPTGGKISITKPAVVKIKVTNTGTAPEAYFVDGRTSASADYPLTPLTSAETTVPLTTSSSFPEYLVPSQTTGLAATASTTGTEPIQFDAESPAGDPDFGSGQGTSVSANFSGAPVSSGVWDIAPTVVGPFGPTGAANEPVTTGLTATTAAFDPAVSSDTGDLWQASVGGPITVSPIVVQPGKSATIPVIIAPTGTKGSTVTGTLYIDDDSLFLYGGLAPNANTVAAVPYSYKIGG